MKQGVGFAVPINAPLSVAGHTSRPALWEFCRQPSFARLLCVGHVDLSWLFRNERLNPSLASFYEGCIVLPVSGTSTALKVDVCSPVLPGFGILGHAEVMRKSTRGESESGKDSRRKSDERFVSGSGSCSPHRDSPGAGRLSGRQESALFDVFYQAPADPAAVWRD